jgi:hypothetical protein
VIANTVTSSVDELSVSDIHLFNGSTEPPKLSRTIALRVNGAYSPTAGTTITVKLRANGMEISHPGVPVGGGRFDATFTVAELATLNLTAGNPARVVVEVTNPAYTNDTGGLLVASVVKAFVFL